MAGSSPQGLSSPHSTCRNLAAAAGKPCVYAGPREPTAVNLASFARLCQQQKPGFHRFFQGFLGFLRFLPIFRPKNGRDAPGKRLASELGAAVLPTSVGAAVRVSKGGKPGFSLPKRRAAAADLGNRRAARRGGNAFRQLRRASA